MQYLSFLPLFQPLIRSPEDIQTLKEILAKQHAVITRFGLPEFKESGGDEAIVTDLMKSDNVDKLLEQIGGEVIDQVRTMKLPRYECQFYCYDIIEFLKSMYDPSGRGEWRWKMRKEDREMEEKKRLKEEQKAEATASRSCSHKDPGSGSPSKRPFETALGTNPGGSEAKRPKQHEAPVEKTGAAKPRETSSMDTTSSQAPPKTECEVRPTENKPPSAGSSLRPIDPMSLACISPMNLPPSEHEENPSTIAGKGGTSHEKAKERSSHAGPSG